jgi:outer membrane protein OmpA-like peptidoglycan-associated protein
MIPLGPIPILLLAGCSVCPAQTPAVVSHAPPSQSTVLAQKSDNLQFSKQEIAVGDGGYSAKLEGGIKAAHAAREQARQSGDRNKEAEAALDEARTIELWATVDVEGVAHLPEAIDAYQAAIERGTPRQQALAANNLGVLFIRQRNPAKAVKVFRKVGLNSVATADAYLYQFNYGRALELNRDADAAFKHYYNAVKLRPDYTPAIDCAFRVLWSQHPPRLSDAVNIAGILWRNGRSDLARKQLIRSLKTWSTELHADELLGELVRSYAASPLDPSRYKSEDSPVLKKLDSPLIQPGVDEISLAYSGQFDPITPSSMEYTTTSFKYWTHGPFREAFGELLKSIGDYYLQAENYHAALACYTNAWGMARLPDAALYTAALLRDHPEIDPKGELLDNLIESLFFGKGDAYSRKDWPNILRLHTVLATIFESKSQWGSPDNPRSAIFQWEHALEAQRQLDSEGAISPPLPRLHIHLANSYSHLGRVKDAQREYLAAAKEFDKASEPKEAQLALAQGGPVLYEGGKTEVKGMITSRAGETFTVNSADGNTTVVLTDDTVTRDRRGLFGLDKQRLSSVVLIPGLKVKVDGTADDQGRVVAKTITTDGDDLETAEMIQAGLHPTAEQVATNVKTLEDHQGQLAGHDVQLASHKENIETNQQNIGANKQQIEENIKDIEEHSQRFAALTEFDVKGETTVKFSSGSAKIAAADQDELKKLAETAAGLKGYIIEVMGYADATGNPVMNTKLSEDRAKAVINHLVQQGNVPVRHIVAPGAMGEYGAAAPNETKAGRAENRRVVVKILVNKGIAGS